jgi:hypothetical protein
VLRAGNALHHRRPCHRRATTSSGRSTTPIKLESPTYDRDATQQLVDMLNDTGNVASIYFSDPHIRGVTPYDKHDDHLHVKVRKQ